MINKGKIMILFSWLACFCWMLLIFYLSHQPGNQSSELSAGIVAWILSVVPIEIYYMIIHVLIRKIAHFFAYFILGILVMHALRDGLGISFSSVIFALAICFIYAISDEVHQLYIPGRSGEVRDVIIDSIGAIVGISMYVIFTHYLVTNKEV